MWLLTFALACGDKDEHDTRVGDDTGLSTGCPEARPEADGTWQGRVGAFFPEGHPAYPDYDIQDAIYVFSADYQQTLCSGSSYGQIVTEMACDGCIEAARFTFQPFETGSGDCAAWGLPAGHVEPDIAYARTASLTWQGEERVDVLLALNEASGRWCPVGSWSEQTGTWLGEEYELIAYSTEPGQPSW